MPETFSVFLPKSELPITAPANAVELPGDPGGEPYYSIQIAADMSMADFNHLRQKIGLPLALMSSAVAFSFNIK